MTQLGNPMDQDAEADGGLTSGIDAFAVPTPVNKIPFVLPYVTTSLPLIIPGPYVTNVAVPNAAAGDQEEVNNGIASELDLTFNRDINAATFTAADVLRITGPNGVIYDRSTNPSGPLTVMSATEAGALVTLTTAAAARVHGR